MARYRRKPIEVEAVVWLGLPALIPRTGWLFDAYQRGDVATDPRPGAAHKALWIKPSSRFPGGQEARPSDVVVRHADGTLEVCKAQGFLQDYERVDPPAAAGGPGIPGPPARGYWNTRVGRTEDGAAFACDHCDSAGRCTYLCESDPVA